MNFKRMCHMAINLILALALAAGASLIRPATSVSAARIFYVSRNGNNADGLSWATAWNELSRINWSVVSPGDTILVDGGAVACPALGPGYNCGMVYNSTLSITKSGTSSAPITIRLASEAGRNGTAIIDGGITAWSRCAEYASEPTPPATPNGAGVRETGIALNASQWVVVDGTKWGGIEVRNHTRYGVNLSGSQRVTARYLKIHHNTDPSDTTNNAVGITQNWQSAYNTVSRVEIFRNGQDAVRGAGDFFTLEESYIHNHYCNHPDGIQSFVPTNNSDVPDTAGEVRGLIVRRNVFDKIGMQTIFLGENATHNSWNIDVTIHDNLFLNNDYVIKSKHGSSRNWNIYNNTVFNARNFAVEWCCSSPGAQAPMSINNNIVVNVKPGNTAFYLPTGGGSTVFNGNCLYNTGSRNGNVSESGTVTGDPLFINTSLGNFALSSSTACPGKGSSITSVNQLLSLTGGSTSSPPAQPTNTPVQPTVTATQPPATATTIRPTATTVMPTATSTRPPATATRPPATATAQPTSGNGNGNGPRPRATSTSIPPTATLVPPTATPVPPTATNALVGTTSVTFRPAADVYADAGSPNSNYGLSTIIRTYATPEQRTFLRFDVQGVAGRPVTQALLRVYANGSSSVGFQVYQVTNTTWTEMGLTYNNMPAIGSLVADSGSHGGARWVTVDVTNLIRGDGSYNLALVTTSTKAVSYPSDEASANGPQLVLDLGSTAGGAAQPTATSVPPTSVPPTATQPPAATAVPPTATTAAPTGPATLTFAPNADAYVDAGSANSNYGTSQIVRTFGSPEQRTYLRFQVQGVAGRPITKALLRIYANGSSAAGFVVQGVPDSNWSETSVNYNNRPRTNGEIASSGAHNHATWVTVDITRYITGDGTYTVALLTDSSKAVGYPSREATENIPQLVLTVGN